jgi:hypothetical protein
MRVCSIVHALVVVVLAFRCVDLPELDDDKVFGTHPYEGQMEAFSAG